MLPMFLGQQHILYCGFNIHKVLPVYLVYEARPP